MEVISSKQAICITTLFIMGSTLLIGTASEAGIDNWISIILGLIASVPLILIYSRILSNFKGKDFFEILEIVFGKVVGKFFVILYIWYSFHLGAMVLRNFGEFINVNAMPETPMLVPLFLIGMLCILVVKSGVENIGRCAYLFFPISIIMILIVSSLGIPNMNLDNLLPILGKGFTPVLKGSLSALTFPFAETVLLMPVISSLQSNKSIYKVYLTGLLLGGAIVLFVSIRNILLLGDFINYVYFPSHLAVSRINIGDFIQRIEVTVAIVLVISIFIKASVCLLSACKGISRLTNINNYRFSVIFVGLAMIIFSFFIYRNIAEMTQFAFKVYTYYALPFQVLLPIVTWIGAEIRVRHCQA